ncbi:MAG TPA: hypothetical protein VH186_18360 [Chloroflexia bacterium]|nr:hypothetical protein [Chloroflexia bacterium]
MVFYIAAIVIGLIVWLIYTFITGTANVLNLSLLGILAGVIILIGVRRGYNRGAKKEAIFACVLIAAFFLREAIRSFIVNTYNFIAFAVVIPQLNNRGITKVDPEASKWRPDAATNGALDLIIFFTIALVAYALTSGKPKGPPGKDTGAKDTVGGILGGAAAALFLTYMFVLSGPILTSIFGNNTLAGLQVRGPDIKLPDLQVQPVNNTSPLAGWERWLPIITVGFITFFVLYKRFLSPPTKTVTRVSLGAILGLALLLAIVWVFALRQL